MNKLSIFLILSLICLGSIQIIAQGQYQATPLNNNSVANQIYNDYGADINISVAQIEAHLVNLTQAATYNATDENTTLDIAGIDATSMSVNWDGVLGNTMYRVAYKNLSDASDDFDQTSGTTWTWNDPADDALILMSITTFKTSPNGTTSSFADIIIIERLAFFIVGAGASVCDCENSSTIASSDFNGGASSTTIDWFINFNSTYVLEIEYVNTSLISYLKYVPVVYTNGGSFYYGFNALCLGNLWQMYPEFNNPLVGIDGLSVYLNTANYDWELSGNEPNIKSVKVKKCNSILELPGNFELRETDLKNTELFPNPAGDYLTLNLSTDKFQSDEKVAVDVFDQMGRTVLFINEAQANNNIDLSTIPAGHYFLSIKNSQNQEVHQFVKMD